MLHPETDAEEASTVTTKPVAKRKRVGKPKVKTGCTTCKIRRIKCDEAKPHCKRCTSTGRSCDGYAIQIPDKSSLFSEEHDLSVAASFNDPWNRLLDHPGTPQEHRYLVFFQRQTAPILSGYFDAYFWNGLLLQVGHSEPTIQHAMMAVASIHEQVETAGKDLFSINQGDNGMDCGHYFALQQYNKAIYYLNQRLTKRPQSEEITLMCIVLFICLEFLRGNVDTAISHLHSGLEIMEGWRARNRKLILDEALPIASEPHSVPENLVQMFSRLSIQSMLCGRDPPRSNPFVPDFDLGSMTPDRFRSLQAARTSLDFLMKVSLVFLREANDSNYQLKPDAKTRLDNLKNSLDRWTSAFDLYLVSSSATRTPQEIRAATSLRILNIVARVWLSSTISADESIFDGEMQAFSTIVNLASTMSSENPAVLNQCESGSASNSQADRPHSFTFEMGVIPPLYFVAMKCRVPSIRRVAVSLLNATMPRREGFWIASLNGAIAQRIIQIEEEDLEALGHIDALSGELLPPEWRRVRDATIQRGGEDGLTERIQKVTFLMRPAGPDGPLYERIEDIPW